MSQVDPLTIDRDIACVSCGYSLRGLCPDANCPECGMWIRSSTLRAARLNADDAEHLPVEAKLSQVVHWSGAREPAVLLVWLAVRAALDQRPDANRHVRAAEVCEAFRQQLRARYEDRKSAIKAMRRYGLSNSLWVGNVVYWLAAAGLVSKGEDDRLGDFTGLFDIESFEL